MSSEAEASPVDEEAAVRHVRPLYRRTFEAVSLNDAVTMSADGTIMLGLGRDGFTYGETTLSSVWQVLRQVDLGSYRCRCERSAPEQDADATARCSECGLHRAGASIVDLGSGIGNVVVGVALLAATGELPSQVGAVAGVELLPTLHAAATQALDRLHRDMATGSEPVTPPLPLPLPPCTLHCACLEAYGLGDCDVVYMASTVFEDALLERFASRAAHELRPGARVVTLGAPLRHPVFRQEAVVPCVNSWGTEDAFVHVREAKV